MAPIVVDLAGVPIRHGERGYELDAVHPEACLCGEPDYWKCTSWLMGWDTVGGVTLTARDDGSIVATR